jgi:hypothetical protein
MSRFKAYSVDRLWLKSYIFRSFNRQVLITDGSWLGRVDTVDGEGIDQVTNASLNFKRLNSEFSYILYG